LFTTKDVFRVIFLVNLLNLKLPQFSAIDSLIELPDRSPSPHIVIDPLAAPQSIRSLRSGRSGDARQFASGGGRLERRDSVAKMAYSTLSSFLQGFVYFVWL
jgi:hypothetical protein